jgi:hypothetical protein
VSQKGAGGAPTATSRPWNAASTACFHWFLASVVRHRGADAARDAPFTVLSKRKDVSKAAVLSAPFILGVLVRALTCRTKEGRLLMFGVWCLCSTAGDEGWGRR